MDRVLNFVTIGIDWIALRERGLGQQPATGPSALNRCIDLLSQAFQSVTPGSLVGLFAIQRVQALAESKSVGLHGLFDLSSQFGQRHRHDRYRSDREDSPVLRLRATAALCGLIVSERMMTLARLADWIW